MNSASTISGDQTDDTTLPIASIFQKVQNKLLSLATIEQQAI
jgi:hypothetical protein